MTDDAKKVYKARPVPKLTRDKAIALTMKALQDAHGDEWAGVWAALEIDKTPDASEAVGALTRTVGDAAGELASNLVTEVAGDILARVKGRRKK